MKTKTFTSLLRYFAISLIVLPTLALAQYSSVEPPIGLNPNALRGGTGDILAIFNRITNWIFTILLILAVIFILLAAFNYLTGAAGDGEKIKTAHRMLIFAVVAVAIAFLAQGILFVVSELVAPGGASGIRIRFTIGL